MRLIHFLWGTIVVLIGCAGGNRDEVKQVLPGANQIADYLPLLSGKSVAVVANSASIVNGIHLVDTLLHSDTTIRIKKVFTPEHGFSGRFEAGHVIESEETDLGSIKIVSLYGKSRKPKTEELEEIDIVVFDLQDVGVRFYTYISTLHYVMQACAENQVPLLVLDRPNPHCNYVDGPSLEPEFKSFVGMHEVPVVYGMTIGEYAKMINGEGWLGEGLECDLTIVPIMNFKRNSEYVFPVIPSPNLPNMRAVYLYPSLCFLEGTEVSVGRGTEEPFQVYGHPEFQECEFNFTPQSIPGVSDHPKLKGEACCGFDLRRIPIDSLKKTNKLDISFLLKSYGLLKMNGEFFTNYFDLLAGNKTLREDIISGKSEDEIRKSWEPSLKEFQKIREKYLIYPSQGE